MMRGQSTGRARVARVGVLGFAGAFLALAVAGVAVSPTAQAGHLAAIDVAHIDTSGLSATLRFDITPTGNCCSGAIRFETGDGATGAMNDGFAGGSYAGDGAGTGQLSDGRSFSWVRSNPNGLVRTDITFTYPAPGSYQINYTNCCPNKQGSFFAQVPTPITASALDSDLGAIAPGDWAQQWVDVTLTCSSPAGGTCAATHYRIGNAAAQPYSAPFRITGNGWHTVGFYSLGASGATETTKWISFGIDSSAPTVALVEDAGNAQKNRGNPSWFTAEPRFHLSGTDAESGIASLEYNDGSGWTAAVGGVIDVTQEGTTTFETRVTNGAGLTTMGPSRTVNVDLTKPVATTTVTGPLGADGKHYTGPATVTIASTDAVSGATRILYTTDFGANWHTYTGPVTVDAASGYVWMQIAAYDVAGWAGDAHAQVFFDQVAPVSSAAATGTMGHGGWFTSAVTVGFSATDVGSGVAAIEHRVDQGPWLTGALELTADGVVAVEHRAIDAAGLVEVPQGLTISVDVTPPAVTFGTACNEAGAAGWCRGAVTVTPATTDATSGSVLTACTLDGVATTCDALTTGAGGTHTVTAEAVDGAGNIGTASLTFDVDQVAPGSALALAGTPGTNGWFTGPVTATVSCADPTPGSGCAMSETALNGGAFEVGAARTIADDGIHALAYRSADVAGNVEADQTVAIAIDQTHPEPAVMTTGTAGANGWWTSDVDVALACTDAMSGVLAGSLEYRIDGGSTTPYTAPLAFSDGVRGVEARCTDEAGNVAPWVAETVRVDTESPRAAIASPDVASDVFAVFWAAADDGSGVARVRVIETRITPDLEAAAAPATDVVEEAVSAVTAAADGPAADARAAARSVLRAVNAEVAPVLRDVNSAASEVEALVGDAEGEAGGALDGTQACVYTFTPSVAEVGGSCERDPTPGWHCYTVEVTDLAGRVTTTTAPAYEDVVGALESDACILRVLPGAVVVEQAGFTGDVGASAAPRYGGDPYQLRYHVSAAVTLRGEAAEHVEQGFDHGVVESQDRDFVPDAFEPTLCDRESSATGVDGHCNGDDYFRPTVAALAGPASSGLP